MAQFFGKGLPNALDGGERYQLLPVNVRGSKAEILFLPAAGLKGNTHIAFADINNIAVADLPSGLPRRSELDLRSKSRSTYEPPKA